MHTRRAPSGFTLVEILVALLLLSIMMLGIGPLFLGGMRGNAVGWDYSELNNAAKGRLEEILQYAFDDDRLSVPSGATFTDPTTGATGLRGQVYQNEIPADRTVNGATTPYPYRLVYIVEDFPLDGIPEDGSLPDPARAVDDGDAAWITSPGVKLVTVYAASSRGALQRKATYGTAGLFPSAFFGKQVRVSALKSP
jgi:prepilin-type N-terminal cleavage/methylation domain-containing protein